MKLNTKGKQESNKNGSELNNVTLNKVSIVYVVSPMKDYDIDTFILILRNFIISEEFSRDNQLYLR